MKAIELLKKQIASDRLSSSYIFCGSDFSLIDENINILSQELSVSKFAIFEIAPEKKEKTSKPEIKVAVIRDLIKKINLTPAVGGKKLAIIRDADLMNQEAANTLLKTLEEPPKNSIMILISKNLRLLPTIISRCQIIKFSDKAFLGDQILSNCFNKDKSSLADIFKQINNIAEKDDLPELFDSLMFEYQNKLINLPKRDTVEKIKKIFKAKTDISVTTNKKLVLENLYLTLRN